MFIGTRITITKAVVYLLGLSNIYFAKTFLAIITKEVYFDWFSLYINYDTNVLRPIFSR